MINLDPEKPQDCRSSLEENLPASDVVVVEHESCECAVEEIQGSKSDSAISSTSSFCSSNQDSSAAPSPSSSSSGSLIAEDDERIVSSSSAGEPSFNETNDGKPAQVTLDTCSAEGSCDSQPVCESQKLPVNFETGGSEQGSHPLKCHCRCSTCTTTQIELEINSNEHFESNLNGDDHNRYFTPIRHQPIQHHYQQQANDYQQYFLVEQQQQHQHQQHPIVYAPPPVSCSQVHIKYQIYYEPISPYYFQTQQHQPAIYTALAPQQPAHFIHPHYPPAPPFGGTTCFDPLAAYRNRPYFNYLQAQYLQPNLAQYKISSNRPIPSGGPMQYITTLNNDDGGGAMFQASTNGAITCEQQQQQQPQHQQQEQQQQCSCCDHHQEQHDDDNSKISSSCSPSLPEVACCIRSRSRGCDNKEVNNGTRDSYQHLSTAQTDESSSPNESSSLSLNEDDCGHDKDEEEEEQEEVQQQQCTDHGCSDGDLMNEGDKSMASGGDNDNDSDAGDDCADGHDRNNGYFHQDLNALQPRQTSTTSNGMAVPFLLVSPPVPPMAVVAQSSPAFPAAQPFYGPHYPYHEQVIYTQPVTAFSQLKAGYNLISSLPIDAQPACTRQAYGMDKVWHDEFEQLFSHLISNIVWTLLEVECNPSLRDSGDIIDYRGRYIVKVNTSREQELAEDASNNNETTTRETKPEMEAESDEGKTEATEHDDDSDKAASEQSSIASSKEANRRFPTKFRMFIDSAKVRFCCDNCGHGWTSMKGRVVFWYELFELINSNDASQDNNNGNGNSLIGYCAYKLFGQQCDICKIENRFERPMWYPEEVTKVLNNLYNKIGQIYFGFKMPAIDKQRRAGKPKTSHNSSLCQACHDGVCTDRK